jgi:hypothetical protein
MGFFGKFQKTAQSKQSPNRRNFAQFGHPAFSGQNMIRFVVVSGVHLKTGFL